MNKTTRTILTALLLSSALALPSTAMARPADGAKHFAGHMRGPLARRFSDRFDRVRAPLAKSATRKPLRPSQFFTIIDEPDADPSLYGTRVFGINEKGQISGQYMDSSGQYHAFLGTPNGDGFDFTPITVDGSNTFTGILNDRSEMFGTFDNNDTGVENGWVQRPGHKIETFAIPEGTQGTIVQYLNNRGQVSGNYFDDNGAYHSYIRDKDGTITKYDDPMGGAGEGEGTNAIGIDNHGDVTGLLIDGSDVFHGFIRRENGSFEHFDFAGAGTGAFQGTFGVEIEDNGWIAGAYIDSGDVSHGLLRKPDGTLIGPIDPPDAGTGAFQGVIELEHLEAGWAIGEYIDSNDLEHGFICKKCETDRRTYIEFDPPGTGDGGTFTVLSSNKNHVIAGAFKDENGIRHGFIRYPKEP
jgi:hypothetical protein